MEQGHLYVYDFDIRGYFDNIPHKGLMRMIGKYVSDGNVLDLRWRSLKAGYMEDGVTYDTPSGTMQGGVISLLVANICYLNELDWDLHNAGLRFVRYADDAVVMWRDEAELERVVIVVGETLARLGLELSGEKKRVADMRGGSFDFLGFTFKGCGGRGSYFVAPGDRSLTRFRSDLKAMTRKTYSKSFEQWEAALNLVLRGKFGYFLAANRAARAVWEECRRRGMRFHGRVKRMYRQLDAYVRQRLRVNFANRGRRHAR